MLWYGNTNLVMQGVFLINSEFVNIITKFYAVSNFVLLSTIQAGLVPLWEDQAAWFLWK